MLDRLSMFVFGDKAPSRLPERVRTSISDQQVESERLISWVQLLLLLVFATLYAIAPKPGEHASFQPVPLILSLYFAFTVMRIIFATRRILPEWLLMSSLVMDVLLLMVLIWSFHIQYVQPPSFYLKAPTMIYVFISLRALRFDPRHILFAGCAAAGWLALLLYVVFGYEGAPVVTRDYVTYLTSNAVLIGAEVDKIIAILLVTGILVISVMRAQRVFERHIFGSTAAQDLSRFVSPEVADRIIQSDKEVRRGDAETKVASILFTDIEGFATVAERLQPLQLSKLLNEYFDAVSEVVSAHGGVITQYQGDLMLITFNAITDNDDHAANAVSTGLAIRRIGYERRFGPGIALKTRCGINTGDVVIGTVGAQNRLVFTMHGDDVNLAARLEALNKDYGTYLLVGENAVTACGSRFPFRWLAKVTVRGRNIPSAVYAVDA